MDDKASSLQADPAPWLLIHQTPGIGCRTYLKLLHHFGSPEKVLAATRAELQDLGLQQKSIDHLFAGNLNGIQPSLEWLGQPDNHLLTLTETGYPPLLAGIADPPPLLFVHGDPAHLCQPQLAIVGSRNPSPAGLSNARNFAAYLAGAGITITSGLAVGIDGAAHEGALQQGATIAVTGTGLDRVYPASHRDLAHKIAKNGLLVSEFPPGIPPRPENFPRRNRIISGLSVGTLVVEAALQSGSLITARLAVEQDREVFAIPGSIHNPQARGCHALIRQGAKLVETGQDIVDELSSLLGTMEIPAPAHTLESENPGFQLDPDYRKLLDSMGYDPISADALITSTGLTPEAVSSMLLLLELEEYVSSAPGGYYCRTEKS
ncbi:MAG: DNA-protecting protein DprA [gamma proteobacterium endosymbiont of Lamellibrachia anaximandri]|nr:DNA-protecting protein DprA [gamma proteobacterium endosymbiont of Lamellibrachia anaximandri]MBL3616939.1 DNA-protecting protein DprA [gamma proteobacterium endosymbiont of Lamellibrachia anaximandri]